MKNIKIIKAKYIVESDRRKGKAVICLDTGEVFTSAKECADIRHFPYANFAYKLRDGKPAVDGLLYCYVADMAYYADAIQSRIYAKTKMEYDAAMLQLAEIECEEAKTQHKKAVAKAKVEKLKMVVDKEVR